MENPFKETRAFYNSFREVADTQMISNQKAKYIEQLKEKEKQLSDAPNHQKYKAISDEIDELNFKINDRNRALQIANEQRPGYFHEEEREKAEVLYNKEITPMIKRYEELMVITEKAIVQFEKAAKDAVIEMAQIEKEVTNLTPIRMKLRKVKRLPVKKPSLLAENIARWNKSSEATFPGVVISKLLDLKRYISK